MKGDIMVHLLKYRILNALLILALGVLVFGCAAEVRKPLSQLDTPEHHVTNGMKFMDQKKYQDSMREFELALQLDPQFSKAHAGMGLLKAYQKDYKAGFDSMKNAWKCAKTDDEKVFVHVGNIRLQTMAQPDKSWLQHTRDAFDSAVGLEPKSAAAHYFMGSAYKSGLEFQRAGEMFSEVVDLNSDYMMEADNEWKLVQKIQRAMPGTVTGKKIALVENITRADMAALFMEELKIDRLYEKRSVKTYNASFKDPEKAKADKSVQAMTASDIAGHPLKSDVEGIILIGVRGLESYSDGAFHPDELITRAAYAMMIEDILIKVTGDRDLATKFIGSTSPFPDLRPDLPYFNSVMVVTSRGIMDVIDIRSAEFAPLAPVSGADALLIIRKIKEELKF
jgi:hypothetical protein